VTQIASSIKEFGFTNPVLIDADGGIIAGHGRVMAAKKLKMESVPVVVLSHLTEAQRRAYVIADNKLALNAGWDAAILQDELKALDDEDFDLSAIKRITIVACGTSFYAGMVAKYWIETFARVPVDIDVASEFRYRDPVLEDGGLAIFEVNLRAFKFVQLSGPAILPGDIEGDRFPSHHEAWFHTRQQIPDPRTLPIEELAGSFG
jgi:hypothetical protein